MLKVIDLDNTGKERDRDAYIFTLTVAGEKVGVTEEELAELIRSRAGVQKGGKKARKAQGPSDGDQEHQHQQPEFDAGASDSKAPAWLGNDAQNLA